jgi:hypothetical protein
MTTTWQDASTARRLKTANTNLLAGRATVETMYPLVPAELGKDFDLERVLRFGSIPLVWQAADARATLEAYVQFYVREEIRAEALVRNLPAFRFLPVAALFHGILPQARRASQVDHFPSGKWITFRAARPPHLYPLMYRRRGLSSIA